MEVASLTAQLGIDGLQSFLSGMKEADRQVNALREDLRGLARDAEVAKAALAGIGISDTAVAKQAALNDELRKTRDLALEIRAASGGSGGAGGGVGASGLFSGGSSTSVLARDAESQFRRDVSAGGLLGGLFGAQEAKRFSQNISADAALIPSADLRSEANRSEYAALRDIILARRALRDNGGGGGGSGSDRGALFGLLPGGARPSQAALTTLIGLGIGAAPAIAPSLLAAAPVLGAGAGALGGAAGTLKLAFDGITSAAFTSQKAFEALSPAQQQFVTTLRSLDAGLGSTLKGIAQTTLLPQLSAALHTALSPSAVTSLSGGVGAFGGALGGGAQDFAKLFGSSGFQDQFGKMLQQDAGYLKTFLDAFTTWTDAIVRFQVSAGPLLTWLGKLTTSLSDWVDTSIQADQTNGRLANFFDILKTSLQATGELLLSLGHFAGAFVDAIGFQNSVALVNLLSKAINGLADFLKANSAVLQNFFKGAIQSGGDVLKAIEEIAGALTPLLREVDTLTKAFGGFRVVLDAIIGYQVANWVLGIGLAATVGATDVGILRLALLSLDSAGVLAAITAVAAPIAAIVAGIALINAYSGSGGAHTRMFNNLQEAAKDGLIDTTGVAQALQNNAINATQAKALDNIINGVSTIPRGVVTGLASAPGTVTLQNPTNIVNNLKAAAQNALSPLIGAAQTGSLVPPAFGTPGAFGSTGSGFTVPNSYLLQLAKAQADPNSTKPQIAALRSVIAYLRKATPGLSPTNQTTAYGDLGGYEEQLNSLLGVGSSKSGVGFLSVAQQARLASATQGASGLTGSTDPTTTTIRALNGLLTQLLASQKSLTDAITKGTYTGEQLKGAQAEQTALHKQAVSTAKALGQQRETLGLEHILGIAPSSGNISAASETGRVRSFLNSTLKQFGLSGTGSGALGPFVQELRKNGDINSKQYQSLEKILKVIEQAKGDTGKIATSISGNVSQRLAEIKSELQNQSNFGMQNAVTTEQAILKNSGVHITGTAEQRARFFDANNEKIQNHNKLNTGDGSIFGVPITRNGTPALVMTGDTHININGVGKGAEQIANEVYKILLKNRNRNTTQMTGANAGRNLGTGLG